MEASTKENIIKTLKTYILSKDEDESLEGLKELLIKYPDCLNIDVSKGNTPIMTLIKNFIT